MEPLYVAFFAMLVETAPDQVIAFKIGATLIRYFANHVLRLDRKIVNVIMPLMGLLNFNTTKNINSENMRVHCDGMPLQSS